MARIENRPLKTGQPRWRVRWREGGGRDGEPQSETFDDERTARRFMSLVVGHGEHWPPGYRTQIAEPVESEAPTVAEFVDVWARTRPGIEPRSIADDERTFRIHVLPDFGNTRLDQITRFDVAGWLVEMENAVSPYTGRRLSTSRMANIRHAFASLMDTAIDAGHRPDNPVRGHRHVRRDRDGAPEMCFLTPEEFGLIRDQLRPGPPRDLATLLITTGLRWSEAVALEARHIDVLASPAPQLRVEQAWKAGKTRAPSDYYLGPPKTKRSRRTVTLSGDAVDAVIPYLVDRDSRDMVFPNRAGNMWHNANFHTYHWQPAIKAAQALGLGKRPRPHDLRHSHVSWLVAAGRPLPSIQRRLGHESIQTTIDRYAHLLPDVDTGDLDALDLAMAALRHPDRATT